MAITDRSGPGRLRWTGSYKFWGAFAALVCAGALYYRFDPTVTHLFPPCLLHSTTGFYCPGCGSQRAIHQLLHGNISRALAFNPLMVLSLPVILMLLVKRSWLYSKWAPWSFFVIFVIYGVLRNIPIWPFTVLAPH